MSKKSFYITTPIYYVNDKPHIGHAYTNIAADVLARYHRLLGESVFFLTGTDEHGQKVERAAQAKGLDPKTFVDQLSVEFKKAWDVLGIEYDAFIRTTDAKHKKVVVDIIKKCAKAGDIYRGTYEGQYCTPCESYWTPLQLVNNACPSCNRPTEKVQEESYFFKLSKYQQKLLDFYEENPLFLAPKHRAPEIVSRVKQELKDLSITRTAFHWGVPFPLDKKHVTYVWFDALTNYLSGIDYPKNKFKKYWPANVHVVGKEINWFHTVIWPAMLFSAGIKPPRQVYAHGWLTINGEKMSKSKGNVLSPDELVQNYGVDAVRYFLLSEIPFGQDGDFSEQSLIKRVNAELADALGNLVQRILVLIEKRCQGKIPKPALLTGEDKELASASQLFTLFNNHMMNFEFHLALKTVWTFIGACNKYITQTTPWNNADQKRVNTILYCLVESLRIVSFYIYPFIPRTAEKMAKSIGQKIPTHKSIQFKKTTKGIITKKDILFKKIQQVVSDDFGKLDLRTARVIDVQSHPNADKLYVLTVDLGSEKRTLVAGLKQYLTPEQLLNRTIVIVANLKPHNFRGVESKGMLLAADRNGKVIPLEPKSKPGKQVMVTGIVSKPAQQVTIEEFSSIVLTTKNRIVVYKDKPLHTEEGLVTADIDDGATIR